MDPTQRFTSRVENYVRYRPTYAPEILELLRDKCGLNPNSIVADLGSGTGISSKFILQSGATVIGVEPNDAMRIAAETLLAEEPRFISKASSAEATTLEPNSIDLIVAGQAFHWFDPFLSRQEFQRILKPNGYVALMWNDRVKGASSFLDAYGELIETYSPDYQHARQNQDELSIIREFFQGRFQTAAYRHAKLTDFEGLKGRLLSSSYAPEPGHPNHEPMLTALEELFAQHQSNNQVEFIYETQIFWGILTTGA